MSRTPGEGSCPALRGPGHRRCGRPRAGTSKSAVLTLAGDRTDPADQAIQINTTITPLEGGWARIESFSAKGDGQAMGW